VASFPPSSRRGSAQLIPAKREARMIDDLDSDTEDAALVLEELALGKTATRMGSRARRLSQHVSRSSS
jgi:hypothetical protein